LINVLRAFCQPEKRFSVEAGTVFFSSEDFLFAQRISLHTTYLASIEIVIKVYIDTIFIRGFWRFIRTSLVDIALLREREAGHTQNARLVQRQRRQRRPSCGREKAAGLGDQGMWC
jgi:hypothetical protein